MSYDFSWAEADKFDANDSLARCRDWFHIPKNENGEDEIYFCGNSLGLQPKKSVSFLQEEMSKWQNYGVKGHFLGERPWMPYHKFLMQGLSDLVGANLGEAVAMNSLTTNLHLFMTSFYQPTKDRFKILIEEHAFPSDHFAVQSQIEVHGFDPLSAMVIIQPEETTGMLSTESIISSIMEHKDTLALILLPGVQYYTGQVLDMARITEQAQKYGILIGFDLAHAVGNIPLHLHKWGVDFAVWCHYKYLNSGPGAVGGGFVHEKHHTKKLPRLCGWWGHDQNTRFQMENHFMPMKSVEAWQLSNPPIASMALILASLNVFSEAGGMLKLREKSVRLTNYLEALLLKFLPDRVKILTPPDVEYRGAQLSLRVAGAKLNGKAIFYELEKRGVVCDWRNPDVIRVAPVPLYNRFNDVFQFVRILDEVTK